MCINVHSDRQNKNIGKLAVSFYVSSCIIQMIKSKQQQQQRIQRNKNKRKEQNKRQYSNRQIE